MDNSLYPNFEATNSAIARDDVNPGDSIPIKFTKPGNLNFDSSSIRKSRAGSPCADSLGLFF